MWKIPTIGKTLAILVGTLLFCETAYGASVSYSVDIPLIKTNWSRQVTFPKLPTASGTLTSVAFTLSSSIEGTLKVESIDSAPSTVTSRLAAQLTLARPDGSALLTHAPEDTKTDAFSAFDGAVDYGGDSGRSYDIASEGTGTAAVEPLSAEDAALFGGAGTVALPLSAEGVSGFDGAGNLQSEATLLASSKVTVTYTYVTPDLTIGIQPKTQFFVGEQGVLLLTVRNSGDGQTTGATTVSTVLPSGLSLTAASGGSWSCSAAGQSVTCTHEEAIGAGASADTIALTVAIGSRALPGIIATATVRTPGDGNERQGANTASTAIPVAIITTTTTLNGGNTATNANSNTHANGSNTDTADGTAVSGLAPGAFGGGAEEGVIPIDAQGCEIPAALAEPLNLADTDSCFEFVADRAITFSDIVHHQSKDYIEVLKKTRIRSAGDFIVSGHGNHSSGKQQAQFQAGTFPFQPDRSPSRLEVVKIGLIANCLAIESGDFSEERTFTDVPKAASGDAAQDFLAQIFYTAARYGIVAGYPDGSARPMEQANNAEILAFLLRASGAMPEGFTAREGSAWYEPYLQFASANHLIGPSFDPGASMDRGNLSKLLVHIMALDPDPAIAAYIAQIDVEAQSFTPQELFYAPLPQLGDLEPSSDTLTCEERATKINTCLFTPSAAEKLVPGALPPTGAVQAFALLGSTSLRTTGNRVLSAEQTTLYGSASRLEVLRAALSSQCIQIPLSVNRDDIPFADIDPEGGGEATADLAARVFTAAATYEIITGGGEHTARPSDPATLLEALVIALRSADAIPEGYAAKDFSIPNLPAGDHWYDPYVSFALAQSLLDEKEGTSLFLPVTRARLALLLTDTMRFSADPGIRSYRTAVDGLLK
ncbi:MAG: choice-of-anchor E domain-containing protein [Candidatus Peribacteraceae bacterium]|nr:choice-of-anchor E domain-containing protein [Candidatus Peribacteraceae bacterium]